MSVGSLSIMRQKIPIIFLITSFIYMIDLCANSKTYKPSIADTPPIINKIIVSGNKTIASKAILNRLPYKTGNYFEAKKSTSGINNIYALGFFSQIQIETENLGKNRINIYVLVKEKKLLEKVKFKGNNSVSKKEIRKKLNIDKIITIDQDQLNRFVKQIKQLYRTQNYHMTDVSYRLIRNKKTPNKINVFFEINEGPRSLITHVFFKGNRRIPSRKLAKIIFTRENWLLSFIDEAGKYKPDQLDIDKYRLEYFYRDHGYITAKIIDTDVKFMKDSHEIQITFEVEEGPQFKVGTVKAIGDEIFTEKELYDALTIRNGEPYEQKKIVATMQRLKNMWGKKGYVYADVYPQLKPDTEKKTVDITFHVERGTKMYINSIDITGNTTTHAKVILREIVFEEGDLLTTDKLLESKGNIDYLGYFERDGANWKIHRITNELADLEMNVKETKTGQFNLNFTYGSDKYSQNRSVKGIFVFNKRNLFGRGWDTGFSLQGNRHHFQRFQFDFFDPYLFDTHVSGAFNFYIKNERYEQWKNVVPRPEERVNGGTMRFGFSLPNIDKRLQLLLEFGVENIDNNDPKVDGRIDDETKELLEPRINRAFQKGNLNWIAANIVNDNRNHRIYPNEGYRIAFNSKFAFPFTNSTFSIAKAELEASWYTSLIGRNSLVLAIHAKAGIVRSFEESKIIPYKELFHMGGQNSVRGFVWGSIGPAFLREPIGGRNMVQINTELIFPLIEDYSMKAHIFYDAGAGWDTPKEGFTEKAKKLIKRDKFDLRHSIGFGLNLLYPQPVKVDFGYKLDRNREEGESASEWHLSMNMAW